MSISILLVDDHPVFRKGLRLLLKEEADMQVIGEAGDGQTAIERVRELSPDVVVMDITMPNFNGIDATRQIVSEIPNTRVVALSVHSGKRFVENMLGAGAAGYILKLSAPEELVTGIRSVMRGEVFLSAGITGVVVSEYLKVLSGLQDSGKNIELNPKESETLQMIAEGQSTKQIATVLKLHPETVQATQQRIMEKLDISDEAEITEVALHMGLLDEEGSSVPSHEKDALPILHTKLQSPSLPHDVVPRAHLVARLDELLGRPLTLVSAAAGYGKSTMASLWLQAWNGPFAWVSLDEEENDLRLFLAYLVGAIRTMFPKACDTTQSLLQAPGLPPVAVLSRYLLNDLVEIKDRFILVLDDYHRIYEKRVHDLMAALLAHPPQNMHVMLLSRRDPPLRTITLRGRNQVNEIGISELRFMLEETASFLKKATDISINETSAETIHSKIEGWAAGMRLISQALKHKDNLDHVLKGLSGGFGSILEYLVSEVLSRQSAEMGNWMTMTAILDRFCAPLCDALQETDARTGKAGIDGTAFIAGLQKDNLFLISLDMKNYWFRYHHIFHELLQSRLTKRCSAEEIATLHSRASKWFTENALIDEAIEHGVAAGDMNGAVRLVEQNRQEMLNRDRWYVFEKWLLIFPDAVIQQQQELLLAQAWVHYFYSRFELIAPILDSIDSLLGDRPKDQPLYGEINLFKGTISYLQGNGSDSLKYIEEALDLIPADHYMIRGFAEIYFGLAGQMQGQKERVVPVLFDLLNDPSLAPPRKMRVMISLVWIYMISGDLGVASKLNQQLWDLAVDYNSATFTSWSSYNQGTIHFHRNELDAAIHHFCQAREFGYLMLRRAEVDCMSGLILAYQATHQTEKANATLEHLFEYLRPFNNPALLEIAHSCKARLSLLSGEESLAAGRQSMTNTSNIGVMAIWLEIPTITQCRVLLEQGAETDFHEVEKKLQENLRLNQAQHNTSQMIEILVLLAMAVYRQGRLEESLDVLEQVVSLAEPGGWVRPFVEFGRPMAELLNRLLSKNIAAEYIGKLLAAFRDDEQVVAPDEFDAQTDSAWSRKSQPLVEPLTNRELDILELLAQRLQNKEIAEKLFISTTTVKTHLQNIYQKLNVTSRRQAVTQAYSLGILTRP